MQNTISVLEECASTDTQNNLKCTCYASGWLARSAVYFSVDKVMRYLLVV